MDKSLRDRLLHPLRNRGIGVTDLPRYPIEGPDTFHVVVKAPSSVNLYLLRLGDELTIGFGEKWHCHLPLHEEERAVELVEAIVSGTSAVVEWYTLRGKYTSSGPVAASELPGKRRGDRFVVLMWTNVPE